MRRADSEAADWAATMHGAPTDKERAAFDAWYARPGHAEAYAMAEEHYMLGARMSRERIGARSRGPRSAPGRLRWAVAGIAAVGIALGFAWHVHKGGDVQQIVAGPMLPGQLRLADGSTVTLMDGAWAEPQFTTTERRVRLHGGRARFEVARDTGRPFVVVAGRSETVALGTVFEIDAREASTKVKLFHGSVEVRLTGTAKALRLAPGERAEVPDTGPRLLPEMASPVPAAMLAANNLPLGAVLDAANKTGGRTIRLSDQTLASLPVAGRFDVSDGESLARKLAAALGLVAEINGEDIILRKK
ncbi:FecR family protein [Sphingopyxis sp. R3-92]|uniref:FecR family protein n=1 Tax=Sphingopyxis sp. R3-92 TaxID=3158553 RepID=UPI003EE66FF5